MFQCSFTCLYMSLFLSHILQPFGFFRFGLLMVLLNIVNQPLFRLDYVIDLCLAHYSFFDPISFLLCFFFFISRRFAINKYSRFLHVRNDFCPGTYCQFGWVQNSRSKYFPSGFPSIAVLSSRFHCCLFRSLIPIGIFILLKQLSPSFWKRQKIFYLSYVF